jgi:molecular chaperone DnaK (HSP70)
MSETVPIQRQRRKKRDKKPLSENSVASPSTVTTTTLKKKRSKALQKHGSDKPSGGMEALLPSLIGLAVLVCGVMAKMGFRGRSSVAGIDLGTTNSVICVQAPSKGVGAIECIPDPYNESPIVPSVVSFLEDESSASSRKKSSLSLFPPPHQVIAGAPAKKRIDSHPHHTLYNAKRVLGRRSTHEAADELRREVEFSVVSSDDSIMFQVPHHHARLTIAPQQVGAYVVNHLMELTKAYLGHDNVKAAVICVPAKFDALQRQATAEAFRLAGVTVTRMLEEPTAAALAYGLHKKEGVDYILVYDFGGGTLDVSILHVSEGFAEVMGSDGDDQLGGADFDAAVAHVLLNNNSKRGQIVVDRISRILSHFESTLDDGEDDLEEVLTTACPEIETVPLCTLSSLHTLGEQLKIGLSAYPDGGGTVQAECLAVPETLLDSVSDVSMEKFCQALEPFSLSLSSSEYNKAVEPLLKRSASPVTRLLKDLDLTKEDIDEVVMVGGTTRMPQIRRLVQDELGVERLNTYIDPDITVAYGAASVID